MELVRKELFQYFMDVCHSLETRLLNRIFLAKAKELYDAYRYTMEENGDSRGNNFFMAMVKRLVSAVHILLKHPNKRF